MNENTVVVPADLLVKALDTIATVVAENNQLRGVEPVAFTGTVVDGDVSFADAPAVVDAPIVPAAQLALPRGHNTEPEAFGEYADSDGDVWEHGPRGWAIVRTVEGPDVAHLTRPMPWHVTAPFRPLTALSAPEPVEDQDDDDLSLRDAAAVLRRNGIDTGQNRLREFLVTIGWTAADGTPNAIADDMLTVVQPANPSRGAVVRVTPEGVNELARFFGTAA